MDLDWGEREGKTLSRCQRERQTDRRGEKKILTRHREESANWDSSDGIVTRLGTGRTRNQDSSTDKDRDFLFFTAINPALELT
jgi:hypothetical protein